MLRLKLNLNARRHVLATMAGGAADCSQFIRWTAANVKILEMNKGIDVTVKLIAKLFANEMRNSRGSELSVGTMVCGWDADAGY